MTRVLFTGGTVVTFEGTPATSLVVEDERIVAVGDDVDPRGVGYDEVVRLDGRCLLPAFPRHPRASAPRGDQRAPARSHRHRHARPAARRRAVVGHCTPRHRLDRRSRLRPDDPPSGGGPRRVARRRLSRPAGRAHPERCPLGLGQHGRAHRSRRHRGHPRSANRHRRAPRRRPTRRAAARVRRDRPRQALLPRRHPRPRQRRSGRGDGGARRRGDRVGPGCVGATGRARRLPGGRRRRSRYVPHEPRVPRRPDRVGPPNATSSSPVAPVPPGSTRPGTTTNRSRRTPSSSSPTA